MKRIRRGPDEVSLSRLSMSAGPVKYDHEIFVSAHAGDLQGVLRYFEPSPGSTNITPAPSSTLSVNAGGNDPDASISSSNLQSSVNVSHGSQATSADVDTSGVRSPRPGTTVPIISNGRSTPQQLSSSSKKRHPSSDKTNFDASNSEYIDRLLHCAAKFDWPEFIGRQLVLAPGFRTSKVKSAFRRACAHGSLGVVKLMLDGDTQLGVPKFCNLADAGTDGKTGLHIACHHGRPRVIEELLARAAQSNKDGMSDNMEDLLEKEDLSKTTPLLLAVAAGHTECIKALLLAGAQVVTKSGKSAIDIAVAHNLPEVADLLGSYQESGVAPITLAQLAHDQEWDKLTSWTKFACSQRFGDTFEQETAFYWSVFHGHADAAVLLGIKQGEAMKRTQSTPWEAEIVDFLLSETHAAARASLSAKSGEQQQQNFVASEVVTKILEGLFMPLVEAESNFGMVEPEQQKEQWAELTKLVLHDESCTAADQDNNNVSKIEVDSSSEAHQVNNPWPSICTLLGSVTIGLPQMCYGFLRVLPTIIKNAASDEKFKKDFITLVINCISFDRQRSEAKRFGDVLAMVNKLIERGDWELSRQIYQFLLQSAFILRLGWYPECLPLIPKFAEHINHLWNLHLIADETSKASLRSFLLEFEGARNEKDKQLFDLLVETDNSSDAILSLMRLGCRPSRKPDCCPDARVADLLKKARFFPEEAEEFEPRVPSVAEIVRRNESHVLLNLLRRPDTTLTARDLGFTKSRGRTAYEWCSCGKHDEGDGLVKEMHFFLIPILMTAIQENDVATLSTLLHELSSVAFTLKLSNDKNIIQLIFATDYKYPPVRSLVLQVLESTQPKIFQELINTTTLSDVVRMEDHAIARKYLDNSANFAFESCRVYLPLDSSEVNSQSRQRYYDVEEGQGHINGCFAFSEEASNLDSRQKSFFPASAKDNSGFRMMELLINSLRRNQKFTRNTLLGHPSISTWVQINWKQFRPKHNRFLGWNVLSLLMTCLYVCCFSFWSQNPEKHALQSFWILLGMWVTLVAINLPCIAWETNRYSILGAKLYFYHVESYLKIGSIALPMLFGFPVSYLAFPVMSVQKGILIFAPMIGSLALMTTCGSRSPGKAIMMFIKTLDQFRKLYFYMMPVLGFLVSFLAIYGSFSDNTLQVTINGIRSVGSSWLEEDMQNLTVPLLAVSAAFVIKTLILSIFIAVAVKVTLKVDEEAEALWNQRRLAFMYQAMKEEPSLIFKAAKVVMIGKPPATINLCLNHFVLGISHLNKGSPNEEVTTVYQFKKFVNKLKNNPGKSSQQLQHQQMSEVASVLQRLESQLGNHLSTAAYSENQDFASLKVQFSKIMADLEELKNDVKGLKAATLKSKSPERKERPNLSRTESFTSSALRLLSPSK